MVRAPWAPSPSTFRPLPATLRSHMEAACSYWSAHVEEANVRRGSGAPNSIHGRPRSMRLNAARRRQPTRPTLRLRGRLPLLDQLSQPRLLLSRGRVRIEDVQGSHPASGYLGQSGRIRRLARPSGVQHGFVDSRSSLYLLYTQSPRGYDVSTDVGRGMRRVCARLAHLLSSVRPIRKNQRGRGHV